MAKTPGGGIAPGKDEGVVNGHKEGEANPFAEYMWMENEEDYNRQVGLKAHTSDCKKLHAFFLNALRCTFPIGLLEYPAIPNNKTTQDNLI